MYVCMYVCIAPTYLAVKSLSLHLQARNAKEEAEKAAAADGIVEEKGSKEPKKAKEDGDESDEDDESKGAKPM